MLRPGAPLLSSMISHVYIGITDFGRAFAFYTPLMIVLGLALKFRDDTKPWAAWVSPAAPRPLFIIGKPYDGMAAGAGNGHMVALLAPNRAAVAEAYRIALANGGTCEGPPGLRPHYHAHYYGAYCRDPDGNKLCICCHDPE